MQIHEKKTVAFAILLIEKPDNWVGIAKKEKITPKEERISAL